MYNFIKINNIKSSSNGIAKWRSFYNNLHPSKRFPSLATSLSLISICIVYGFSGQKTDAISVSMDSEKK